MKINELPYKLYLLFIISFFLRLSDRLPFLGYIRFDLILIFLISALLLRSKPSNDNVLKESNANVVLKILMIYIVISLPFVEWKGSVISYGIPNFIKAVIFFYFTSSLITTEERLKKFLLVFIVCQSFRILEPLYLHIANGYWGAVTYMGADEMMDRLSGAPHDIVNPNGLAFVITSVIPFFHYTSLSSSMKFKIIYLCILPLFLYTLVLTASRTGFLALGMIVINLILRSKKKLLLILITLISAIIVFLNLSDIQRDRYLSIYRKDVRGSSTAHGRLAGDIKDFQVAMEHPLFGHGLGTSIEANYHATGEAAPSHFLYTEILQELGFIGLIIYLFYLKSIISNFHWALKMIKGKMRHGSYLLNINNAMLVWLWMNILYSFASYGLSSYEWYLFGGLSLTIYHIATVKVNEASMQESYS